MIIEPQVKSSISSGSLYVMFMSLLWFMYHDTLFWSSLWFTLQPGFENGQPYPITVLAMTLGELNFVDNFVSGLDRTFYYDNLTLFILFAMIMPISLMNLLVCSDFL